MLYRPDIDGLRAISVLLVIAYHAFPTVLKGGYVGVDVFFVISGYLITSLICSQLEQRTFTFKNFYSRRVLRLFPALIVVLLSCFAVGWFVLLADEFKSIGKHMFAASIFTSNLMLRREFGYFEKIAELKPLVHLWSLGIEEQFYIAWPVIILIAFRKKIPELKVICLISAISFAYSIYLISGDQPGHFIVRFLVLGNSPSAVLFRDVFHNNLKNHLYFLML